jgi:hypothetical protein
VGRDRGLRLAPRRGARDDWMDDRDAAVITATLAALVQGFSPAPRHCRAAECSADRGEGAWMQRLRARCCR